MNSEPYSAQAGAPRVPPSPAISAEYWGGPEDVRPHLTTQVPLDVLAYWEKLRGARRMPARADFDPMAVRRHLPLIFMLDALPREEFRYRVVGTVISDFFGAGNVAGRTPEDVFGEAAEVALSPLRICTHERALYMHRASAEWRHRDRTFVHYEVLLLPLGESDEAVDKVLCCAEFLSEEEAARA